ncbi:30S ribosomal protein S18 [Candidatus Roizmanbacteria bacterium]|nr:30S ribosomal protein S18 [Candidatus Roizmanbacteria bacterium]
MAQCFFCKYNSEPSYKDGENIEKFLSPRKKILSREQTGVCANHQRKLNKEIKYARLLAIIPFVAHQSAR